jgi:hypothetical protein
VTTSTYNYRLTFATLLVLLVVTVIPYQLAYLLLCVAQIVTCIRALIIALDTASSASPTSTTTTPSSPNAPAATPAKNSQAAQNFYNYAHSMLVLMIWILPGNMPVLIVWFHNLAVRWLTPFPLHDNLLAVVGYIALVETMASGEMIPRVKGRCVLGPKLLQLFNDRLTFLLSQWPRPDQHLHLCARPLRRHLRCHVRVPHALSHQCALPLVSVTTRLSQFWLAGELDCYSKTSRTTQHLVRVKS